MITGQQDIDKEWIAEIRKDCDGSCPLIVPRINWEARAIKDEVPLFPFPHLRTSPFSPS